MTPRRPAILVRRRRYIDDTKRWTEWETLLVRPAVVAEHTHVASRTRAGSMRTNEHVQYQVFSYELPLGGRIRVFPGLVSTDKQGTLVAELLENSYLFRQYQIQGGKEPRVHYLLHKDATDDETEDQPGYKYGTITMKAVPLEWLPEIHMFAEDMEKLCDCSWNVGVNPVYYRGERDHMGLHADNDQGETKILTVLVQSPAVPRRILIQTATKDRLSCGKRRKKPKAGD